MNIATQRGEVLIIQATSQYIFWYLMATWQGLFFCCIEFCNDPYFFHTVQFNCFDFKRGSFVLKLAFLLLDIGLSSQFIGLSNTELAHSWIYCMYDLHSRRM
jgi:hypothetical protein